MPLLPRLSTIDTWGELENAAWNRYWDSLELAMASNERSTGAVYLLGYVFEMLIKTAYYRIRGLAAGDDAGPALRGMPARARTLGFPWQGNRHNTGSLAGLLVYERRAVGRPLDPMFAATLLGHAQAVANVHWSEALRYKETIASESEIHDLFRSVEWLRANYSRLWS